MKTTSLLLIALLPAALAAKLAKPGPWWPNAEWGPTDQAGASNRITPEKIVAALTLVKTGRVYEIGQVYERGMPMGGTRDYALRLVPAIEPTGTNRVLYNDEFLAAEVGQVGTQFDGLGHVGGEVRYADGTLHRVFYNGFTTAEMNAGTGLRQLGIEHVKPMITRGVLVDLPAYKNVQRLEGGYEVTLADVRGALARQGIAESSIDARRRRAVSLRLGAALEHTGRVHGAPLCPASASRWRAGSSSARSRSRAATRRRTRCRRTRCGASSSPCTRS